MNVQIKRSTNSILIFLAFVGLFIYKASKTDGVALYLYAIIAALFVLMLIGRLVRSNYITVEGDWVTINRDFFRRTTFSLQELDQIALYYSPFASSYFQFKDDKKIKFDIHQITKAEADKLSLLTKNIV